MASLVWTFVLCALSADAFVRPEKTWISKRKTNGPSLSIGRRRDGHCGTPPPWHLYGGEGFGSSRGGNNKKSAPEKTYSTASKSPIPGEVIDTEGAMKEFFSSNEEWHPLFRSIATGPSVPAMSFLGGAHGEPISFANPQPWTQLDAMPTDDSSRAVLASFLDSMQKSLVDIPVFDGAEEDENDLQFIEEGRRMLVISRFHVLSSAEPSGFVPSPIDQHDLLFATCWSELAELRRANVADTGSLIVVPEYDIADLRRFTDMYLQRPLAWLGTSNDFEVASMERGSSAIRIIHKLSDIPTDSYTSN